VHDHIDHCLEHALKDGSPTSESIEEFKQITKYL
jgi:DNA-binding FrmR family transcriptional regulator